VRELVISEHGGRPISVRTTVDECRHEHRRIDNQDQRRS